MNVFSFFHAAKVSTPEGIFSAARLTFHPNERIGQNYKANFKKNE